MKELGVHRSPFALLYGSDGRLIQKRETHNYDDLLALVSEELPATARAAGIVKSLRR